ncbi:MAG: hypothetical protein FJ220_07450, partial [Kiritimatiellaceae bacterium]|nr:hypothetical protein [Kiritimatiellaceae bacterium]
MTNPPSRLPFRFGFKPAGHWITVLFVTIISLFAGPVQAEDHGGAVAVETEHPAAAEHAEVHLTPDAPTIFMLGPVPVTNSMITGWLAAGIIIVCSIRFRQQVRAGRHTLFTGTIEELVIFLNGFLADIMGEKLAKSTFWLLGSFFIFILLSNWLGLFPGVGSIGWGHETEHMFRVTQPLFRGVNADLNTTLALG